MKPQVNRAAQRSSSMLPVCCMCVCRVIADCAEAVQRFMELDEDDDGTLDVNEVEQLVVDMECGNSLRSMFKQGEHRRAAAGCKRACTRDVKAARCYPLASICLLCLRVLVLRHRLDRPQGQEGAGQVRRGRVSAHTSCSKAAVLSGSTCWQRSPQAMSITPTLMPSPTTCMSCVCHRMHAQRRQAERGGVCRTLAQRAHQQRGVIIWGDGRELLSGLMTRGWAIECKKCK